MIRSMRLLVVILVGMAVLRAAVQLSRQGSASLSKGPYLQNVTPDSIVIMWQTSTTSPSLLEYGNPAVQASDPEQTTIHAITLSGLSEGTRYPYRVSIDGRGITWSEGYTFQTAPAADQPFRLAVYGDTRSNPDIHRQVIQAITAAQPALVLHTGDLVANGLSAALWQTEFFDPAGSLLHTTPLYPALGNHDLQSPWYFSLFSLPGNEQWYAFSYGSARIIALDTTAAFDPASEQFQWLVSELQSPEYRAAQWHIVFFHMPPFSSSSVHAGDAAVAGTLVPLFEQYGVQMVFSGHHHAYERSEKANILYITTGGGGAPLYDFVENPLDANPYSLVRNKTTHYCTLDVTPAQIDFAAWDLAGTPIDSLTILAE